MTKRRFNFVYIFVFWLYVCVLIAYHLVLLTQYLGIFLHLNVRMNLDYPTAKLQI